jgi:hypothetical protein
VTLPAIRWIVGLQPGRQHGPCVGAGAAGHCGIDEFDVRVSLGEHRDHGVEASRLATTRPPREHFDLIGHSFSGSGGGVAGGGGRRRVGIVAATSGCDQGKRENCTEQPKA